MKKIITTVFALSLSAALLAGCGQAATSAASQAASSASEAVSEAASSAESVASSVVEAATDAVDQAAIDAAVAAIEAVNQIPNARAYDDFSVENEMGLTMDNLVAYKGDVTNDQGDCALVFVAQAKEGTADAVKSELEAYQATMTSSLYAEFADKVEKAKDARIGTIGNFVYMVIAGVNGPDYGAIDTALSGAFAS